MFIWKHAPYIVHHCHVHYYGIAWNLLVTCALLSEISIWKFRVIHLWYKRNSHRICPLEFFIIFENRKIQWANVTANPCAAKESSFNFRTSLLVSFFSYMKDAFRMIIIVGAWSFVCILSGLFASTVIIMGNCCVCSQMSIVLVMINC